MKEDFSPSKMEQFDSSMCDVSLENLFDSEEGRKILTCIQCGMCVGTCPHGYAMQYPPRRIIGLLRAGMIEKVLRNPDLLLCVACYSCMVKCPRKIQLTHLLLPAVKVKVFESLPEIPEELQRALENTFRYGNPMGESPRKRADWVKEVDVPVRIFSEDPRPADVLWWVECYSSYHPRGKDATKATARILNALEIDFAILGNEERCAGECARLEGEVGLFDDLTDKNIKTLKKYKFNKIVSSGAHAYDAFKYQYPCRGFKFPLEQITPFLAKHLKKLKPLLKKKLDYVVTYHDSCCLGKHNGFYEEPRALLSAIPGIRLVEMVHNRENSLCCGGGGGGMWLDTYFKVLGLERLSERRAKEAIATGADVLAVSCPYEVSRFEDAIKVLGYEDKLIVRDVVELLDEAMR
ncbi:MAG: (Fe-S)-binding protein [Candidatus Methanofastidiosia archaeon]